MSQKLLLSWAFGATLIAVGAVGYIAGKHAGRQHTSASAASRTSIEQGVTVPQRATRPPAYVVPTSMQSMDEQWRTSGDTTSGFSVLFQPRSQRIVVETCEHPGFPLSEHGEPLPPPEFCTALLRGRLTTLSDTSLTAHDRDGNRVEVKLEYRHEAEPHTLRLSFAGHDIRLQPGSRNDLLQHMEAQPDVVAQKQAFAQAVMAQRR